MSDHVLGIIGIALAVIGLIAQYRWRGAPQWVTDLALAIGCILIGIAIAPYADSARSNSPLPFAADAKPDIRLLILGADIFTPDFQPDWTGIAVAARVWNTGKPSIAVAWSLIISPKGQTPVIAQFTVMPEQLRAGGPNNNTVLRGADSLDVKNLKEPITSDPKDGNILFYTKLPRDVVMASDTWWELSITNSYGVESTTRKRMGDMLGR